MSTWPTKTRLRLTPQVMHKLQWLLHEMDTEVMGFGIVKEEDPLRVFDFVLIPQVCGAASVDCEGEDIAEYIDKMSEAGYKQTECRSVCIHTHPKMSANPSQKDETMFSEVYPPLWPWAVMGIVSKTGDFYARLKIPKFGINHKIPFGLESIDWETPAETYEDASDWQKEVDSCVKAAPVYVGFPGANGPHNQNGLGDKWVSKSANNHKWTDPGWRERNGYSQVGGVWIPGEDCTPYELCTDPDDSSPQGDPTPQGFPTPQDGAAPQEEEEALLEEEEEEGDEERKVVWGTE